MNAQTTKRFWKSFYDLSEELQQIAKKQFALWKLDPYHNSLEFKQVGLLHSVRINDSFRALGRTAENNTIIWYWIGTHDEYMRLIGRG